jgi:flagellar assembly protein FliH
MALIKNTTAGPLTKGASVFDLGDLTRESEHLLQEAKQQAQQIMQRAEQEAAKLVDSATDRGFAEGKDRGLAQGREEGRQAGRAEAIAEFTPQLKDLQVSFTAALEQWEADRNGMLLAAREDVLRLALAVAEKVTYRIIQTDSTVIGDQLAEALALLVAPRAVTVAVAPQDRALVEAMLPELIDKINTCTHAAIRDDPSVTRGGCVISTGAGRIDATIERQIQRIVDTLLPQLVEAAPGNETPGDDALAEEAQS